MEAMEPQQLCKGCKLLDMAGNLESNSSDSDVPTLDPCLDYINEILMEEGMDDATYMQQVDDASYQATFRGFYEILGEHLPPNSYGDLYENIFDPHLLHESGPDEHVANPNDVFYGLTGSIAGDPANGHPQNDPVKHDSGCQSNLMPGHTPLKSTQVFELHEMKNDMYNSGSRLNSNSLNEAMVCLSTNKDTTARNDGVFNMDAMVSSSGKDAVVEGLRSHIGQGQGNVKFKVPSADEEFSLKLAEVDLSFEDLKLDDVYSALYVGEPRSSPGAATDSKHYDNKTPLAGKGRKFRKKGTTEVPVFLNVREVLVSCAQAVSIGDARRANEILQELHQVHVASANGTGLQRIAHFFSKALAVRMRGMGEHEFRAISLNPPSAATTLRVSRKLGFEVSPFDMVLHYFANQSILKAAEAASRLHIVDYGIMHGMKWPCLINALADRKGAPPLLVITGVEFPQPGINMAERLDGSGRRLSAYAKTYSVPFQFHAIVSNKWEDIDAASLHCHEGEVLVINCVKRFQQVADDSADLASTITPRQKLLARMHSLNPHLLVTSFANAACNSPFFVSRFREALYYYSNLFDMFETMAGDIPFRHFVERSFFYPAILNIVACEGAERVVRPETYRQWQARITKAGFEQLPIPSTILSRLKSHVKQHYHKDFLIHDDAIGWMLMGWKGCTLFAASAWKVKGQEQMSGTLTHPCEGFC